MHIGGVDVVLLVPGGGRQDDVRVSTGGIETKIDIHHQVELGDGGIFVPFNLVAFGPGNHVLHHAVLGTEQVFEEILMALGTGAN